MLVLLLALLFLVTVILILVVPMVVGWETYDRYRGSRAVTCPETHQQVAVSIDAMHAAVTGLGQREPETRLADCTRWPAKARCDQACLPEALHTEPYTLGEISPPKEKRIYHLPVALAAFAAWVLGATWHSEFLFRGRWGQALGLNEADVRRIVEWWTPHLISVGVALLFAYGVAWLLAISRRRGVAPGVAISIGLWAAVAAVSLVLGSGSLPPELLKIELGYSFLASLVVGGMVGGLSGHMEEAAFAEKGAH